MTVDTRESTAASPVERRALNDTGRDRLSDIAVSGSLAALGLAGAAVSLQMENPLRQSIGPGYVPAVVSVCLAILSIAQTTRALGNRNVPPRPTEGVPRGEADRPTKRLLAATALLGGAVWVWSVGGYLAGIACAVFGIMLIDRKVRVKGALSFAVLLSLSLWVLFQVIFKVNLG